MSWSWWRLMFLPPWVNKHFVVLATSLVLCSFGCNNSSFNSLFCWLSCFYFLLKRSIDFLFDLGHGSCTLLLFALNLRLNSKWNAKRKRGLWTFKRFQFLFLLNHADSDIVSGSGEALHRNAISCSLYPGYIYDYRSTAFSHSPHLVHAPQTLKSY